ncbi:MAG: hypothetical protein ACAI38_14015 [Myxococcota bacterium]
MPLLLLVSMLGVEPLPSPTRAEVIAYNLRESAARCLTAREPDGKLCRDAERPVIITGKALDELVRILRSHETYDRTRAAACFEPHHSLVFYNGTSALDEYTICFKCHNTEPGGTRVPCSDPNQCVDGERLTFTDDALGSLEKILNRAKVKGVKARRAPAH